MLGGGLLVTRELDQVIHDRVIAALADARERVAAVAAEGDLVAFERERACERLLHGALVVYHQYASVLCHGEAKVTLAVLRLGH